MAGRIQGIVIEVGGDTTKLQKSLNQIQAPINKINTELKNINQALKLDPKNTELLAQKQEILGRNIAATKDKLNALKEAQKQMGDYANLTTEQQKENYNRLSLEIAKSENALKSMNSELKETTKVDLSKLQDGLKKVGEVALEVSKKLLEISTAVAGALASVVALGVKSYAEMERASNGAKALFGDAFKTVEQNAAQAYKSLGLSATEYYDQVNTYAVGLKEALGGDSEAAAQLSNDILTAQADIVAATGASQDAVQNAFAAVMRGNYTMIDNLRLGIKGSQQGMQEVIDKVNEWREKEGITTKLVMGNYADMEQALVDYVKMQRIAGTAQDRMSQSISGSITQMKAAFDNFLNGSGSPEALSETIMNTLTNIATAIKKLAPSILKGLVSLIKDLVPQVVKLLFELIPQLLDAITDLIDQLLDLLKNNTESIQNTITTLINKVVEFITSNLPKILEIAILLVVTLAKGIAESLPTLIPAVVECVITLVNTLLENIDLIIDAAIMLIDALATAISDEDTLDMIIEAVPTIIITLVEAIIRNLPKILEAAIKIVETLVKGVIHSVVKVYEVGKDLVGKFIQAIKDMLPKVKDKAGEIFNTIKDKIAELPSKAVQWGKDFIQGLINGINAMVKNVVKAVKGVADTIASFLHFSKPDEGALRDYETWMPDFVKGLAKGIEKSSYLIEDASMDLASDMSNSIIGSTRAALRSLNAGINSSLNPTINPSYAYDLNYQLMASAMKEALSDMEVELDDKQVGKFISKTVSEEVYN